MLSINSKFKFLLYLFNFVIQACVQYVSDAGYPEVIDMGDEVFAKVKLDSVQVARLSNIVGFDIRSPKTPLESKDENADL